MTNKKLMKKIAPVVMSAAVAMTSMPYAVLASDFTDSEVLTDSTDFSVSEEFAAEDAQEEFTTEDVQDAFAAEARQGEAYVLMNIPYDDFYKAEQMCIRDSTKGVEIYVRKVAPLGDPVEVTVRGYELSLSLIHI